MVFKMTLKTHFYHLETYLSYPDTPQVLLQSRPRSLYSLDLGHYNIVQTKLFKSIVCSLQSILLGATICVSWSNRGTHTGTSDTQTPEYYAIILGGQTVSSHLTGTTRLLQIQTIGTRSLEICKTFLPETTRNVIISLE